MPNINSLEAAQLHELATSTKVIDQAVAQARVLLLTEQLNAALQQAYKEGRSAAEALQVCEQFIAELAKYKDTRLVIGLFGQVAHKLIESGQIWAQKTADARTVYAYLAPVILHLNRVLLTHPTVMPLTKLETSLRAVGMQPDPIYTTTG